MKKDGLFCGLAFSFCGGLFDAYSYVVRGGVFANTQTGNIVKAVVFAFAGDSVAPFIFPMLAFVLGVVAAKALSCSPMPKVKAFVLLLEICLCAAVAFIPDKFNDVANCMLSFCCALQYQTFSRIDGKHYASIMCTNNLRCVASELWDGFAQKDKSKMLLAARYFLCILCFIGGAALAVTFAVSLDVLTVLVAIPFLCANTVVFFLPDKTPNGE